MILAAATEKQVDAGEGEIVTQTPAVTGLCMITMVRVQRITLNLHAQPKFSCC